MRVRFAVACAAACLLLVVMTGAQDAVKVDPKHYKVETDNAQVRVLRAHYGAHEKSVMHAHPATVAVFLTDGTGTFTYPDGKKENFSVKAGDVRYSPPQVHLPENTSDQPFDVIVIELKGKGGAKPMATTKSGGAKTGAAKK